ncbi:MAG: TfoX/Sxy family protein [Raoultibacter sp.]
MATSEDYLAYVLDLLSEADNVSHRKMMGEYVLYVNGKVFGGIYDERFLVKPTDAAKSLLMDAQYQIPYDGAKPMLAIDFEDKGRLAELLAAMEPELPEVKRKKPRRDEAAKSTREK